MTISLQKLLAPCCSVAAWAGVSVLLGWEVCKAAEAEQCQPFFGHHSGSTHTSCCRQWAQSSTQHPPLPRCSCLVFAPWVLHRPCACLAASSPGRVAGHYTGALQMLMSLWLSLLTVSLCAMVCLCHGMWAGLVMPAAWKASALSALQRARAWQSRLDAAAAVLPTQDLLCKSCLARDRISAAVCAECQLQWNCVCRPRRD